MRKLLLVVPLICVALGCDGPPAATPAPAPAQAVKATPPAKWTPPPPEPVNAAGFPRENVRHLKEWQRREIWQSLFAADRLTRREAEARVPIGPGASDERVREFNNLHAKLRAEQEAKVMARHGIDEGEAASIQAEWADKKWPAPFSTLPD